MARPYRSSTHIFKRAQNTLWTLRYLSPMQVLWRLRRRCLQILPPRARWLGAVCHGLRPGARPLYEGLARMRHRPPDHARHAPARRSVADLRKNRFTFLDTPHAFAGGIDWHCTRVSHLWRYHLHYFGYVSDLLEVAAADGDEAAFGDFKRLADSWIAANHPLDGDGWHPFTVSLRVVNWIHALCGWQLLIDADPLFRARFLSSLAAQVAYLADDLEHDVRGNHLLKNLKALLFAGTMLAVPRAGRTVSRALGRLAQETGEQILPDGGHFERTPGYHLEALRDYLEIGLLLRRNTGAAPAWLDGAIRRMADWLVAVLPPGGRLPSIKDTTRSDLEPAVGDILDACALYLDTPRLHLGGATGGHYTGRVFSPSDMDRLCTWKPHSPETRSRVLEPSGYTVFRASGGADYLICDTGAVCPDYLPAHAHADALSYELHLDGRPVVVDSGVYEYTAGGWRDYFRSTRAHNTVEIDGADQSEVWGSFRVARRARPIVEGRGGNGGLEWITAQHDGYRRLPRPARHRRTVAVLPEGVAIVIDAVSGAGRNRADSWIHLHPDLRFAPAGAYRWRIAAEATVAWLVAFQCRQHRIVTGQMSPRRQGWHSEAFGRKRPNAALALTVEAARMPPFGYVISRHRIDTARVHRAANHTWNLQIEGPELVAGIAIGPGGVCRQA